MTGLSRYDVYCLLVLFLFDLITDEIWPVPHDCKPKDLKPSKEEVLGETETRNREIGSKRH